MPYLVIALSIAFLMAVWAWMITLNELRETRWTIEQLKARDAQWESYWRGDDDHRRHMDRVCATFAEIEQLLEEWGPDGQEEDGQEEGEHAPQDGYAEGT